MIPNIIHFTIPAKPSAEQLHNIDSARASNTNFEIKVWQDPLDPSDFILGKYFDRVNSGAQLADLIRLCVVHKYGGIYLDSDIVNCSNLSLLTRFDKFICASEDGQRLTNAIFAAPPEHPAVSQLIDELLNNEPDWNLQPNITTGPELFSRELKSRQDVKIIPRVIFYPFNWNEQLPETPHPRTLATHTWRGSWTVPQMHSSRTHASKIKDFTKNLLKKTAFKILSPLEKRLATIIETGGSPAYYSESETIIVDIKNGIKVFLDGKDISITPDLVLKGTYEPLEEKFIEKYLHGGDWFVDVGANVGVFSLIAARKVGAFGRVWSFEPNKKLNEYLNKSLIANWFHERVNVESVAVSDQLGSATLKIPEFISGGSTIVKEDIHVSFQQMQISEESITVKTTSLDEFFDELAVIRILKIDVEGHEANVLKGARRLFINKQIDIVLIELINLGNKSVYLDTIKEIESIMQLGYVIGYLSDNINFVDCTSLNEALLNRKSRNLLIINPHVPDIIHK